MNSLVKKSDVLRIFCENCTIHKGCKKISWKCSAYNKVIDLDPVQKTKRGEWVDDGFLNRKTCSICGAWIANNTGTAKLNFCPNCGADMRGDKNERTKNI